MSLKIAIFEDDKDLADILKAIMETHSFSVDSYYSLKSPSWEQADLVLGDFRNKIVDFEELVEECKKFHIPIIAISGAETGFTPQLLKPFTIEELEAAILKEMMSSKKVREKADQGFSIMKLFKRIA